jgi:hypothetical protein
MEILQRPEICRVRIPGGRLRISVRRRDTLLNFQSARANVSGDPTLPTDRSQAEVIAR